MSVSGEASLRHNPDFKAAVAELDQRGIAHRVEFKGKHPKLVFEHRGREFRKTLSNTPGDRRSGFKKAAADIRRFLREAERESEATERASVLQAEPAPPPSQAQEGIETMNATVPAVAKSIANIPVRVFEDEPRILDSDLGALLGMTRPDHLRVNIIEPHRAEIEGEGHLYPVRTNPGPKGGRPGMAYYLTSDQAIATVMLSRAPNAAEARSALRRAFADGSSHSVVPESHRAVDLSPDAAAAIGGIVKVVVHKQLKDPEGPLKDIRAALDLALEEIGKLVDRDVPIIGHLPAPESERMITAYEVVADMAEVPAPRRFGGLPGHVSARLSKYCARHGYRIGIVDLRPGEKMAYPREAIMAWLDAGGRRDIWALVNAHEAKRKGQGSLALATSR